MIGGLNKSKLCLLAGVSACSILGVGTTAAKAASVEELQAQMQAMQAQMKELQREVSEAKAQSASASAGGSDLDLKVKWKGAPQLSSTDGKFKFKVRGRLMGDINSIDQDQAITGEKDINGVELRHARIGVEGVVAYDWKYTFEVDFASTGSEIKDAYIGYTGFSDFLDLEILAGNFKVLNSLEGTTSSRVITFMEGAAFIGAFGIRRYIGVAAHVGGDQWSAQTSYTGAQAGSQETFFDDPQTWAIRGTLAPVLTDNAVVHLGASYRNRNAGTSEDSGSADLFRYRARAANLHLADRFIAIPNFAESDDLWGLEGAVVLGRWSVQGEYSELTANSASTVANVSPTYNGYYVEASVFLTDDMRNYDPNPGEFKRVKVSNPVGGGGWGAWQLAGRYDVLNLSDGASVFNNSTARAAEECTDCGDQETWLIGLNWWMTNYTAIKFNVTQSEISGGANDGAEITGFGMRAQIDW